jgi:cytochrome c-type biogenesis protein CcmF
MVVLATLVPRTLALTPIFAKGVELPIPLLTFGIIAFVFASVTQEFWRGMRVRAKQSGSDPVTSLIGLVLSKRRKYGGYVVHLGVAVMFLGFVGKAYESMTDRTIERPAAVKLADKNSLSKQERAGFVSLGTALEDRGGKTVEVEKLVAYDDPAWFSYRGYRFLYEKLTETHDDNKSAVVATLSVWIGDWKKTPNGVQWRNLERIATGDPGKFDFHRGEQPTTEVSIHPRLVSDLRGDEFSEDVYLTLTGFDTQSRLANFRIYINPLINFVWGGFILLAFGVFICLIPQGLVDTLAPRPKTRLGRAADLAGVLLLAFAVVGGTARASYADTAPTRVAQAGAPGGGGEHEDPMKKSRGGHDDGAGWAAMYRPDTAQATELMKELVCMCGGCSRESLWECKCAFAAEERRRVLEMLADLRSTGMKEDAATQRVIQAFVAEYGGDQVLSTPRNRMSWLFPSFAVVGGLGLLFAVGYRWVRRGRNTLAAAPAAPEDETYAERLDDELRDAD